eukprot:313698-Alexandrium_andersonii.AAC.1
MAKLKRAAEIAEQVTSAHGLFLNVKPGKTAAAIALRGPGARTIQAGRSTSPSATPISIWAP